MGTVLNFTVIDNEEQLKEGGWTDGELVLGKRLKNNPYLQELGKLPDRRIETVWAQVELLGGDKRVDFLVFTPYCIFVIEVKDHSDYSNPITKPWELSIRNAFVQCQEYVTEIEELIGDKLPVIGIVAFPNISSTQSLSPEVKLQSWKKYQISTWFSEEVHTRNIKSQLEKIAKGLEILSKISVTSMVCAMGKLVPNLLVIDEDECNASSPLHVFDRNQINISHDFTRTGDRIIYGVAGSGKTMIIINRAKQMSRLHPEYNILVLVYNKPLSIYLRNELRGWNVEVRTIHAWYRSIIQRWDPELHTKLKSMHSSDNEVSRNYFDMLPEAIDSGIKQGYSLPLYDAILIDEGQDFKKRWFEHLKMSYQQSNSSLFLVCLDSLQAIHHRQDGFTWSSVGIAARGRTMYLRKNYRNRSKIGQYAISKLLQIPENQRDEDVNQYLAIEKLPRKGGEVITESLNLSQAFQLIANTIKSLNHEETCMIIYDKLKAPYRLKGLRKYGISNRKVFGPGETKERNVMPNRLTIPTFSVYRSKGLETDTVFFIHPEMEVVQEIDYVAITRARERIVDITITSYE